MRLSDAIALGRTLLIARSMGKSKNFPCCGPNEGCALDMAVAAIGVKSNRWLDAQNHWGWLNKSASPFDSWALVLGTTFDREVMIRKSMTMDQFIDWVRSIEPNEDSPEVEAQIQSPALLVEEKHVYESR